MLRWTNWLSRHPFTVKITGSNPVRSTMSRSKTQLRHVDSQGKVHRVTRDGEDLYIGNTDQRAEGKCCHHSAINHNNPTVPMIEEDFDHYRAWSVEDDY